LFTYLHLASSRRYVTNETLSLRFSLSRDSPVLVVCSQHQAVPNNEHWHSDTELITVKKEGKSGITVHYAASVILEMQQKMCFNDPHTVWIHTSPLPMNAHFRNKRLSEHVIRGVCVTWWHLAKAAAQGWVNGRPEYAYFKQDAKIPDSYSLITLCHIISLSISRRTSVKALFCAVLPDVVKHSPMYGGSQASPIFSCRKSHIQMKMSLENWGNYTDRGKPKYWEKICPSATLSTKNPTRRVSGSNLLLRVLRPATNRWSHTTASSGQKITWIIFKVRTAQ
jgi:hypothetical protein